MNTYNKFGVAVRGDRFAILLPPVEMDRDEALVLAAWLVALADPLTERFGVILGEVKRGE